MSYSDKKGYAEWFKYSNWWRNNFKVTKSVIASPLTYRGKPALANLDDKFVFIMGGTFRTKSTTDFYNIANDTWT